MDKATICSPGNICFHIEHTQHHHISTKFHLFHQFLFGLCFFKNFRGGSLSFVMTQDKSQQKCESRKKILKTVSSTNWTAWKFRDAKTKKNFSHNWNCLKSRPISLNCRRVNKKKALCFCQTKPQIEIFCALPAFISNTCLSKKHQPHVVDCTPTHITEAHL